MSDDLAPIEIFCSYAHADEIWLRSLETHLSLLKRQGLIATWHNRLVLPGTNREQDIDSHLNSASIILLLISADFLASDYCAGIEMKRALQRQGEGSARVLPILVRSVDWTLAPFAHLQVLPTDAKPLNTHSDKDTALAHVIIEIRRVIEDISLHSDSRVRVALPTVWNIPFSRNPFFTGQEALLMQLADALQTGQPTVLSQPQALSGLGGIGKTQLAVEYAYRHACDYQAILWVRADTHEALISGYVALARLLKLPQMGEDDQRIIVRAVLRWLQTHGQWLLILDNADELAVVREFVPAVFGGHVLLTTRAHALGPQAKPIEVEAMNQEVGALLLLRRAGLIKRDAHLETILPAERAAAYAIAHKLGGLPLALDQAGAYLEETRCSLTSYQQVYQQHRMQLLERRPNFPHPYPFSVATTWALSFEQIKQQNPAAADLLCYCAFLHSDAIPEELFTIGANLLGPTLQQVGCSAFAFNKAIEALLAYSLINRDPRSATLSIHRLVQVVLLDTMPEEQRSLWQKRVVQALDQVFPESVFQEWTQCGRYLPHALVCASWGEHELTLTPEASSLLDKAGAYLYERGQYREAEPLLRRALAMREQKLGAEHPDMVKGLNYLAMLSFQQARYEEMEPLVVRALTICKQFLETEHPETARSLHIRAHVSMIQSEYKQAESLLEQAEAIYEQCLGIQRPDIRQSVLNTLAWVYSLQGKYSLAESLFERVISINEEQLGTQHYRIAIYGWYLLAELYQAQGKYEQAKSLFERALVFFEQQLGTERLETAGCLSGLARVYLEQGKYEQAKPLFEQLIVFDKQHPEAANYVQAAYAFHGEAKFSQYEGKYEQAEDYYQRALAILEQLEGISLLKKQKVQRDYATLLRFLGRDAEATMLETGYTEDGH